MNNYLAHHGVLGMKLGVRRYQNKDGSLTAEGRKHYDAYQESLNKEDKFYKEYHEIWDKHKKVLSKEFGGKDQIDDIDLFDLVIQDSDYLRDLYGYKTKIDTKKYFEAETDYNMFVRDNAKSIKIGKALVKRMSNK